MAVSRLKMKITLVILAMALLASNLIAYKAILLCKSLISEQKSNMEYKSLYDSLLKENGKLKLSLKELETDASKWNLYEERHVLPSRAGSARVDSSKRALTMRHMRVTAYTEYECNKLPSHPEFRITSSGNEVEEWYTAAAGPELPFGTRLYIPYFKDYENKGIFVVEDRGSAIRENCLDIYIADQKTVDNFGCKWLDVYIIAD